MIVRFCELTKCGRVNVFSKLLTIMERALSAGTSSEFLQPFNITSHVVNVSSTLVREQTENLRCGVHISVGKCTNVFEETLIGIPQYNLSATSYLVLLELVL